MNGIEETIGFELTAFDWAIVVLIGLSTLMSLRRGFMKEALSLGTWIAAFVIARQFHSAMDQLLVAQIADMLMRSIASFATLFVGTLIVGAILSFLLGALINATGLSSTDRLLGMVFGFARGALIITLIVGLLGLTPLTKDSWYTDSTMVLHFEIVAHWALDQLSVQGIAIPPI
ncbi:CvpA family protein [Litorivicinus sp.]|jgi:membrane protein required for colicin V production|nr:CvpA family protein [Litorivicinus sp.]MDC1208801.1 CvpA family protein [Litorivicinus sp.]MDC1240238.1 CvpA family protein [Litorivicinus sp.]MDC1319433.1 CvpA family protein [Litorivicinus sp.]|tara:strand:- start:52052 stop:52573 length:522 start_codon:yes stop_codon:yes gene_type:complete